VREIVFPVYSSLYSSAIRAAGRRFFFAWSFVKPEDFRAPGWRRLTTLLEERIEELRQLNDQPLSIEKTSAIRGAIAEIKKILSLADAASLSPAVDPQELLSVGDPTSDGHQH
jgi:hypothetical protein